MRIRKNLILKFREFVSCKSTADKADDTDQKLNDREPGPACLNRNGDRAGQDQTAESEIGWNRIGGQKKFKKLVLKQSNVFDASDSVARYFGDSAVVGDLLITSFPGTKNLTTGERSYDSSVVVIQNLVTGERSEIETQRSEPYNLYDLKDGFIGFDHASGSSPELGFTLVNLADHSSVYVPLDTQPDPSGEREYFQSLARLDGERVIALTSKALWIYNYQTGQIESSYPLPDHIEWPFEIWVRP